MTAYRLLDGAALRDYLARHAHLAALIGPDPSAWDIREVSDGNLNAVHLVSGTAGGVCVKQALPHVRVLPSWKMPLDRALFEARYMRETAPYADGRAPALLHEDAALYLLVMESLAGHAVLRTALAENAAAPGFSAAIGHYVARTCFFTSSLGAPFERMAARLATFAGNTALTRITVDLVLTDPFGGSGRNRVDHPDLAATVAELQADPALRVAAGRLQARFLGAPQALLHGDLHTGSIMLRRAGHPDPDVRVIDGEFAHCGPIGFDCGLYLANLALHAIANPIAAPAMRAEAILFRSRFEETFDALWAAQVGQGDVHALLTQATLPAVSRAYLREIAIDSAGFMGAEMIRRTIGFAHVPDFDLCPDDRTRLDAMRTSLSIGATLMRDAGAHASADAAWDLLTTACNAT